MIKAIEILKLFLNSLSHLINVNSTVDNGDSTYTLFVDNTYYLTINKTITINNIDYIVVDFELNKWIKLKGSTIPAVNEFTIPNPAFLHGTPIMVNNEHSMQNDYPLIWLVEFLEINFNNDFAKNETARLDLNLLFLTDINYEDWIVEDHYKYAIYPMQNEINFIISAIKKRGDLFGDFDEYKIINHVNFGQYITDKGYTKQIISDQLSGCQLKLTLPYVIDVCSDIKKIICKSLPATVKNSDNSYNEVVNSGSTLILPLFDRTLNLLKRYIRVGRRKSRHNELFLCAVSPDRPITNFAIAQVFKIRARKSGLPIAHATTYALRHTFAMHLLKSGVGIKAISDLMGHSSIVSTARYLRLHTEMLRDVALSVPGINENAGGSV